MKLVGRSSFCLLAATWGLGAMATTPSLAATPSVNGANIFAQPSIVDAQGSTWSIVSGVIQKNGVSPSMRGVIVLRWRTTKNKAAG